jgi:hypothetical protein
MNNRGSRAMKSKRSSIVSPGRTGRASGRRASVRSLALPSSGLTNSNALVTSRSPRWIAATSMLPQGSG